ncbi:dolichyl-diphosphooligosaccharide--protein glycosyltransferase subunit 4 [Aspergillus stella-maris]|uniref:dolichyl-diphosphooligosaccharide--protein glycosyltransferase subunit 4 n=1 Tax=Aspergillus stella-maris TaxID=1810926 RepID=UPI003CCCAEAD
MITDNDLHKLAVFLGSCAMMLIVLYHFLEVNAKDDDEETANTLKSSKTSSTDNSRTTATVAAGGSSGAGSGKDRVLND